MQPVVKAVQNVYSLWWGILKSPSRWVLDYPQEVVDLLLLLLLIQAVPLFLVCVILLQVWTLFSCTLVTKCLHSTFPSAGGWQTANPTLSTWPRTFWPPLFGFSSLTCCSERKSSGRFRRRGQTRMPEDIVYISSVLEAKLKTFWRLQPGDAYHNSCDSPEVTLFTSPFMKEFLETISDLKSAGSWPESRFSQKECV